MSGKQLKRVLVWALVALVPLRCGLHAEKAFGGRGARIAIAELVGHGDVERIYAHGPGGRIVEKVAIYAQERDGSSDKIVRRGELHRYPEAQATILIAHGFMCEKEDVGFLRQIIGRGLFNTLTFDFRAHGQLTDEQQCCTFGRDEAHDVLAAAAFLREHPQLRGKPLLAYGFSMGAAALIEAAGRQDRLFDAMVLDCAFDSSETIIRKNLDNLKVSLFGYEFAMPGRSLLQRYAFQPYVQSMIKTALKVVRNLETRNIPLRVERFAPAESIKKVSSPCLFIHCKNDDKIPVESVYKLFECAPGFKKLWVTNGRRHYDSLFYAPERYADEVRAFYELVLSGQAQDSRAEVIEDSDENVLEMDTLASSGGRTA